MRSVPAPLSVRASSDGIGQITVNVLDSLSAGGGGESWLERMLASTACHSSVRAGQTLSIDECKGLILQLEAASHPDTCPHTHSTMPCSSHALDADPAGGKTRYILDCLPFPQR